MAAQLLRTIRPRTPDFVFTVMPFGDLASFVARAGVHGADADTPSSLTAPQDDSIITGEGEVAEAVAVLEAFEDNEGDARMQLAAIRGIRQRLTKLAVGLAPAQNVGTSVGRWRLAEA